MEYLVGTAYFVGTTQNKNKYHTTFKWKRSYNYHGTNGITHRMF